MSLLLLLRPHGSDTTPHWARVSLASALLAGVSLSSALRGGVSLSVTLLGSVSLEEDP